MWIAGLKGLATGVAFGVILYKVGAVRFSRVMGMLTLRDTKIMKFAFTTVAFASLFYGLADLLNLSQELNLVPRVMPFMGYAHLLGGALFGFAMGWTGLCPGTSVAKTGGSCGGKKYSGFSAIVGLIFGIFFYLFLKGPLENSGIVARIPKPITLHGLLGVSYWSFAFIWAFFFFGLALLINQFTKEKKFFPDERKVSIGERLRGEWGWLPSGILAAATIVAATAQNGYLGFSGALLALVGWVSHWVGYPLDLVPHINEDILWRAMLLVGVLPGGVLARLFSLSASATSSSRAKKEFDGRALLKSFVGGSALSLGAMIGGGCTTGAFLAAWPTLSVGSLAMGGTFFAVSMLTSNLLLLFHSLDLSSAQKLGDQVYD